MSQAALDINTSLKRQINNLPADAAVLVPLYEAYSAANEAMLAVFNKPRCQGLGANIIEDERTRIDEQIAFIGARIPEVTSVTSFWREQFLSMAISYQLFTGGNASEVLAEAARVNALPVVKGTKH